MRTVPRTRRTQPHRRRSLRTRRSLALVFALVFAPVAARPARAECVPFTTPPAISLEPDKAFDVSAADLDGDGDLDALAVSLYGTQFAWHENLPPGDGSSWSFHTIATGGYGLVAVAADMDGDGDLDVLANGSPQRIVWQENLDLSTPGTGDGSSWTLHLVSTNWDNLESIAAADLDGDGDLDALAASRFGNRLAWDENLPPGDGTSWTTHQIETAIEFPSSVSAADVDGDGDLDVLFTGYFGDTVAWYENDGTPAAGAWPQHLISTANVGPYSIATADVDGDGDVDAVTALRTVGQVAWHENVDLTTPGTGDGSTWATHVLATGLADLQKVAAADVDGDGDVDALSASYVDKTIAWYENDGTPAAGLWTMHTLSTAANGARAVAVGDMDGDGDADALSASQSDDKIAWYRNESVGGSALFLPTATISGTHESLFSGVAADLDGDGDLDALAAAFYENAVVWHENLPPGDGSSWALATITLESDYAFSVATADVDGDGDLDALSASYGDDTIAWYENGDLTGPGTGDGSSWSLRTISLVAAGARGVGVADLDDDGDVDAFSASQVDNKIAWYENLAPGNGSNWSLHTISLAADDAYSVVAGDVDGDGDLDLLSASREDDKIAWHENLPPGDATSWTHHTISLAANAARSVFAADVDGDGDLDALSASSDNNLLAFHENVDLTTPGTGDGTSWTLRTISAAVSGAFAAFAADVDGDGDLDALAAARFGDTVAWFENLAGDGTSWTTHVLSSANNYATSAIAADLDGDGDLDTLSASKDDGTLTWHENLGTYVFANGFSSETPESANLACWSGSVP